MTIPRATEWDDRHAEPRSGSPSQAPATVRHPHSDRPPETDRVATRRRIPLSEAESAAVDHACATLAVTPPAFFAACTTAAVARHTGESTVVLGVRHAAGTLPLNVEITADAAFSDVLAEIAAVPAGAGFTATLPVWGGMSEVSLDVSLVSGCWMFALEHDLALVPEPVAEGFAGSVREAVLRAVAEPRSPIADLFTDAPDRPSRGGDGHWRRPPVGGLDGWVRRTADICADRVAIEEGGSRTSYRQLASIVRAVAAGLRSHGVRPRQVVGLATTTLTETVIAMLAVLRVGARYLPLTADVPAERLADVNCVLVIGDEPVPGVLVVTPDELLGPVEPQEPYRPSGSGGYVEFTADGTVVDMGEGPLFNLTAWQVAALDLGRDSRVLRREPLSFQEIVPVLVAGGTVVAGDGRDVTHLHLPASELPALVDADLGALTHLCLSGGPLAADAPVEKFLAAHPDVRLVIMYGTPETQTAVTHRPSQADAGGHVPLGRPITGVTAQVIDCFGHLAPPGVPGELVLGGRCPADGYVGDDERTSARFVPDPYGGPNARRFRTGDRVMWAPDGTLSFLGRKPES
ncbi:AMP-binding protein [Actinophytocola sp.]|uniref:AMP-binding protein n=1 Tax=Actinophytocola sp. TaxID=1872138 RepID=UPI002ED60C9E